MPPPRTVTCYICGRDFGSRSIGIHLPSCTKKWDAEQEKLPKKERRPLPSAPPDFDKVVKGELKGKALAKVNQQAAEEFNDAALEACQHCGRTFLPGPLAHHRVACTEEKPMARRTPGESYTAQAKASVNYPKMKSKSAKGKDEENKPETTIETTIEQEKEKEKVATPKLAKKLQEKPVEITIQHHKQEKVVTPKVLRKPPAGPAKTAVVEPEEEGGGSSSSSLVMVSRPGSRQGQGSNRSSQDLEEEDSPKLEKRPAPDLDREEREEREREEFEALERAAMEEALAQVQVQVQGGGAQRGGGQSGGAQSKCAQRGGAQAAAAALSRGPGTLRKSCTFLCQGKSKEVEDSEVLGREELLAWLEGEQLLEEVEHRREVHSLISQYFSQVRRRQVEELLGAELLREPGVWGELVTLLQNFLDTKTQA